ncbi:MAG: hypothetical protein JO256_05275 [Alphaproteobacteria bacterium]|nr:hypothetical protein [Alphaproteobacteria bacterium]
MSSAREQAEILIASHGPAAERECRERASYYGFLRDQERAAWWKDVARRIGEMQSRNKSSAG